MVKIDGVPIQELASGVTVIVAVTACAPGLLAVKGRILPVPLAASPMAVLLFAQVYVVPAVGLENEAMETRLAWQAVLLAGTFTVGEGFTVMV